MQGQTRLNARSAFAALLLPIAAAAFAANAELSAEVPPEKWKALRLKGLPKNASVSVRVETSGPIRVILAHQDEAQHFPKGLRSAFSGSADRRLSFKVSLPVGGTYYIILDNRKGDAAREVRLYIEALPPQRPRPARPAPPDMKST